MEEIRKIAIYFGKERKNKDRKYVHIVYKSGEKRSTTYARFITEQRLGRRLEKGEAVDHIDENKTNDDPTNYQILTPVENTKKQKARLTKPFNPKWWRKQKDETNRTKN